MHLLEGNFCKCCAPSKQCQRFTYTVSHDSVKSHRCTRSVKGESCFCSKCGKDKLKEEERYLTSKKMVKKLCRAPLRFSRGEGDEFIIELSKLDHIDQVAADISRICTESMQPFVPGIPVPCEFALCERWYKGAEAVYDEAGSLQVWKPS